MSPVALAALHEALTVVLREGGRTDLACGRALREHPRLKPAECAEVVRVVYAAVRRFRLLCALAALPEAGTPCSSEDTRRLECALAALERRPRDRWPAGFSPEVARRKAATLAKESPAVYHSLPDWLAAALRRDLGPAFSRVATALSEEPPCVLRVNTRKTSPSALARRLAEESRLETRPVPGLPEALEAADRHAALQSRAFAEGFFEVQDAGSQRIAPALEAAPGMRVLDGCAGEGGKTLHLSNLMEGRGRIVALDVEARKLETLRRRAARADAQNVAVRLIEGPATWAEFAGFADRTLVDAPCSGTGVLRRQPETRWRLTPEGVAERVALQASILGSAAPTVRRGGLLLYATCSLLADENERQVARFLAAQGGRFEPVSSVRILPGVDGDCDGFFRAVLRRV